MTPIRQFGRKRPTTASLDTTRAQHVPLDVPIDSDGKRRIFGERIFETHGDFLRLMGRDLNDPDNILPTEEDHARTLQASIDSQKERHAALEAELVAKHGYALIWPYHLFGDPVWNGPNGAWLMRAMNLLPSDEWNVAYFASDRRTSDLIGLPIHPGGGIASADDAAVKQVARIRSMYDHLLDVANPFPNGEISDNSSELLTLFADKKEELRRDLLTFSCFMRERVTQMLWDATRATR